MKNRAGHKAFDLVNKVLVFEPMIEHKASEHVGRRVSIVVYLSVPFRVENDKAQEGPLKALGLVMGDVLPCSDPLPDTWPAQKCAVEGALYVGSVPQGAKSKWSVWWSEALESGGQLTSQSAAALERCRKYYSERWYALAEFEGRRAGCDFGDEASCHVPCSFAGIPLPSLSQGPIGQCVGASHGSRGIEGGGGAVGAGEEAATQGVNKGQAGPHSASR